MRDNFISRFRVLLKQNYLAQVCLGLLVVIVIGSIAAPLSPYDPDKINLMSKFQNPSFQHWFGTDNLGRDYFTRALYGGRVSLIVGACSMAVSVFFGSIIGTISGYVDGVLDNLIMRCIDIFMSVPSFLLIIIINSFISPSIATMVFIISLFAWMGVARIVRAETLSLKERDFVIAAKNFGASDFFIICRHIFPNLASSIIVAASVSIAKAILTESSLSFLGFGVQLPKSSWGSMLQNAQSQVLDLPFLSLIPGVLILITVLSFNILGDVLAQALEPRTMK